VGFGRLEDYIRGWVQRTYVKQDGWWAQLVLDEFAFLADLGFSLAGEAWVGIHFHQRGHYIRFSGQRRDVILEFDPDDPDRWTIGAEVFDHQANAYVTLDELIFRQLPQARMPVRRPVKREVVEANVRWWAEGLRQIASEVL
jgi:hypothetical protein